MNCTQNEKLNQVTADTLIVGVDIGSQTHFAGVFGWRGVELGKRVFKFCNTGVGFLTFVRWIEEMQQRTGGKKVIVGWQMGKLKTLRIGKANIRLIQHFLKITLVVCGFSFKMTLYAKQIGQATEIHVNTPCVLRSRNFFSTVQKNILKNCRK